MDLTSCCERLLPEADGQGPAAVVGVYRDGALVETWARGWAVVEHRVPAGPDTFFDLASVSKQVTAVTLLALAAEGLLDLDAPLRTYLPALQYGPGVTLRACLQHTAGVREYFSLIGLSGGGADCWREEDRVVHLLAGQVDTDFPPGTRWSYSNSGYILAAAAVRAVTGQGLAEAAADRVLGPLGMPASQFQDDGGVVKAGHARGYRREGDGWRRADSMDDIVGDGGLLSSVRDLAGWHRFLLDGGALGPQLLAELTTPLTLRSGQVGGYGLGIDVRTVAGTRVVGHGGAIEGYRAGVFSAPSLGLGVTVLANRSDVGASRVALALLRELGDLPPAAGQYSRHDPAGLWHEPVQDVFLRVRTEDGAALAGVGGGSARFEADGTGWAGQGPLKGFWLDAGADTLSLRGPEPDWSDAEYRRCTPVAAGPTDELLGDYLSAECDLRLRITATGDGGGTAHVQFGAGAAAELGALLPDVFGTSTHTLRVERGPDGRVARLLVSGSRLSRLAFTPCDRALEPPPMPRCFARGVTFPG